MPDWFPRYFRRIGKGHRSGKPPTKRVRKRIRQGVYNAAKR